MLEIMLENQSAHARRVVSAADENGVRGGSPPERRLWLRGRRIRSGFCAAYVGPAAGQRMADRERRPPGVRDLSSPLPTSAYRATRSSPLIVLRS